MLNVLYQIFLLKSNSKQREQDTNLHHIPGKGIQIIALLFLLTLAFL